MAAYRLTVYLHLTNSPISISYILITLLSSSSNKPISSYLWGWWHNLRTTLRNWCMLATQKSKFVQWSLRWTVCIGLNTFDQTEWTRLNKSSLFNSKQSHSFYIFLHLFTLQSWRTTCLNGTSRHRAWRSTSWKWLARPRNGRVVHGGPRVVEARSKTPRHSNEHNKTTFPKHPREKWFSRWRIWMKHRCCLGFLWYK